VAVKGGWQRKFDEPIETPDGAQLTTLREAVAYLAKTVPSQNAICRRSRRQRRFGYFPPHRSGLATAFMIQLWRWPSFNLAD